ncbi:type I-E CRISPR-associated protein Cse1/CasA [Corynebacterium sp. ES2730-CONJ]|uniref:type I-E CRISPR-associated protein Cse1/CasA n=1 Tax=Corynebacterium sp. ES2730-CONJ TaxID=2973941 RepID=UPI00216B3970|nr:type I-E CRISPR-associated protein Cse1/CasA [Corynebacterium sp. ES2730-CONJ]MCS4532570.1 type I-E CRISPR-associated protein Cse1/CasA [Corynebacterium sp. ES2730-CONJ]
MHQQFNLIDEEWIPVLRKDLTVDSVSLRSLFQLSDEIIDISCELPTMHFAVFRICLAILRRSVDEPMHEDPEEYWSDLWLNRGLPNKEIDEYLNSVHNRFDLLDPERPFLQTPHLRTAKGEWKDLNILITDSPGEGSLYQQRDSKLPLSYAEAALWLIHAHAYDYSGIKSGAVGDSRVKGGKGYPMGIGWTGWLGGTIIRGHTLKETLLLNYATQPDVDRSKDLPIWEEPPLSAAARPTAVAHGQLSLITWPQRRILLRNNGEAIDAVLIANGDPVDYLNQLQYETMTPWRYSRPQSQKAKRPVFMPKALSAEEALWRGFQSFLPQVATGREVIENFNIKDQIPSVEPPETVTQLGARIGRPLPDDFSLNVTVASVVYGNQSASVSTIVEDKLTFPALITTVEGAGVRDIAETAVMRTLDAISTFGQFAANIARSETDSMDAPAIARDSARLVAFSLVDSRFRTWLSELSIDHHHAEEQLQRWTDELRALILEEGRTLAAHASPNAWRGRKKDDTIYNLGQSEAWFRSKIFKQLPTKEGE